MCHGDDFVNWTDGDSYSAGAKSDRLGSPSPPNHFWVHIWFYDRLVGQ
jgi:hypothetical protein